MNVKELEAKVDLLQSALDSEQSQIAAVIAGLETTVAEQKAIIENGGTEEQRQAIADKIDSAITDLQATIPEE